MDDRQQFKYISCMIVQIPSNECFTHHINVVKATQN